MTGGQLAANDRVYSRTGAAVSFGTNISSSSLQQISSVVIWIMMLASAPAWQRKTTPRRSHRRTAGDRNFCTSPRSTLQSMAVLGTSEDE